MRWPLTALLRSLLCVCVLVPSLPSPSNPLLSPFLCSQPGSLGDQLLSVGPARPLPLSLVVGRRVPLTGVRKMERDGFLGFNRNSRAGLVQEKQQQQGRECVYVEVRGERVFKGRR